MILTEEEITMLSDNTDILYVATGTGDYGSNSSSITPFARAIEQAILDKLQDKLKNAERYEWIRNNTKECPVNPKAFNSDFPDIRLRFDFPVLVSYDCVGNNITLDKAIDSAIAK